MNNIFITQLCFPGSVVVEDKGLEFIKRIEGRKKLVVASTSFRDFNRNWMEAVFSEEKYFLQKGEPTQEDYKKIRKEILDEGFDYLIALGGGSVIDLVKLAARDLNLPMVAMPTTIGSGAEASQHALIIEDGVKKVRSSPDLVPGTVILNSGVLTSLTREQIIYGAIDALAHGFESLTSRISNNLSDELALLSINRIYKELKDILDEGVNNRVIANLQIAGFWAGLAQSSVGTGLTHALAHYYGGKEGISHAKLVATFLIDVLELNSIHTDKYSKLNKSGELVEAIFISKLKDLFSKLKVEPIKIKEGKNLKEVARLVRRDALTLNNPYYPTEEEIIGLIEKNVS